VVTGPPRFGCVQERLDGFTETWAADGPSPVPPQDVVEGDFTFECGLRAVRQRLADGIPFDAVFAHNDLSALGALHALRQAGLRVPEDVAVVGFDDIPEAGHSDPELTTVHQPLREIGEAAAELLLAQLGGRPPESGAPVVIPTTLTVRGSTRAPD
jgi:LacI family transcriptional regulator